MTATTHTAEQGIRVHYLANLGGLVAIAGLDRCPPDLLLGLLLDVAARLPHLSADRTAEVCAKGQRRLEERGTEKRAWNAWHRARELHRLDLSTSEVRRLLIAVTGSPAASTTADPTAALLRTLRGPGNGRAA